MNGQPVITLKDVGVGYSVLQLLTKNLVITSLRLNQPVIHMRREGGAWDLSALIKSRRTEAKRKGPGLPVAVHDIVITGGTFVFEDRPVGASGVDVPRQINRFDAQMSFAYAPFHYTIDISKISFRGQSPQFALDALSGKVAVRGDTLYLRRVAMRTAASDLNVDGAVYGYTKTPSIDVHVTSDKMDFDELTRILPGLAHVNLKPALDVTAKGALSNLALNLDVRSQSGEVSGQVVLDVANPDRRVAGTIHMREVDIGEIIRRPQDRSKVTGVARFDLLLLHGRTQTLPVRATYSLQAQIATALGYNARDVDAKGRIDHGRIDLDATALAYGARASSVGTITLPHGTFPLAYDLRGTVAGGQLRRLPLSLNVPRPESLLNLDYHITGSGPGISGDALLRPSVLAGAAIGNGTKATFSYGGGQLAYSARGTVSTLDLQRIGQQFDIPALKAPRFSSDLNGQFDVSGSGTRIAAMRLDATANLSNSTLMGMTLPRAAVQAALANGTLRTTARGQFRDLNPATVSGSPSYQGNLAGRFNLNVALANVGAPAGASTSLLDGLSIAGHLALSSSSLAGIHVDQASVDGQYANRTGTIRQPRG